MENRAKYAVIIPVYNGSNTIELLVATIVKTFHNFTHSFQILLIYDCGVDSSWKVIEKLVDQYSGIVKGISLTRNYGQHNAIMCGFNFANADFLITMDEDFQHHPDDIINLIAKQSEQDYDVVYGKYAELKHSLFRNITSVFLKYLLRLGVPDLHQDYSAFRLIKCEIAKHILSMNNSYTFLDGYLSWVTTHVGSIEVSHSERAGGKSSYNLRKLIEHSLNIFATFSSLPIRLISLSSIIVLISSLVWACYLINRFFTHNDIAPGFTTLAILLGTGTGSLLFGLGILGEYIYRISLKSTRKPNYIVRHIKE